MIERKIGTITHIASVLSKHSGASKDAKYWLIHFVTHYDGIEFGEKTVVEAETQEQAKDKWLKDMVDDFYDNEEDFKEEQKDIIYYNDLKPDKYIVPFRCDGYIDIYSIREIPEEHFLVLQQYI